MSAKATPAELDVLPRDIRFKTEGVGRGHWLGGDPVGTAVFNALSITFPDGERMFIDAVRHYRDRLSGKLLEDVKGFIAQEAIHSREHHMLNELLDRTRYPVAEIEEEVRGRIAFSRSRGPMRMLIATISLEHFTAMMAEMHALHQDVLDTAPPEIERLWRWHALEETEHKAVAYDVYMEVTKHWSPLQRWLRRCVAMAIIGFLFPSNIARFATKLLVAEGYEPRAARKAVKDYLWRKPGLFSRGWRSFFAYFRPGFHPWDIDTRDLTDKWKADFEATPIAA
jgi:uncharacterized protein